MVGQVGSAGDFSEWSLGGLSDMLDFPDDEAAACVSFACTRTPADL